MSAARLPWETAESMAPRGSAFELEQLAVEDAAAAAAATDDSHSRSATIGDVHDIVSSVEMQTALDAIEKAAESAIRAKLSGQNLDVTTATVSGQKIKLNDAKNRAFRTLVQNLSIDIVVAFGTVLPMLLNMDWTDGKAWGIFGFSVAKTVLTVFISYISRLAVDPVIPTPVEQPDGSVIQPLVQRQVSSPPPALRRRAKG